MTSQDWKSQTGAPIVYIFGIASHEGQPDARAGFGIDWGPYISLIKGGPAIGEKTKIRAELTAIITVIQTAHQQQMPAIMIRHCSSELEEVLNRDRSIEQAEGGISDNEDLLLEIEKVIFILPIQLEKTRPGLINIYANAVRTARRIAGLHSSAAVPISDNQYEKGCRIVDIYGACNDGQKNATAGYGVYWGQGDSRNENGNVSGQQTSYRAFFVALYRALATAADSHHDELIIRSRSLDVHNFITTRIALMGKHRILYHQLASVMLRFKNVLHWKPSKQQNVKEQNEAECLAKLRSGIERITLSIAGFETANDGLARYGVFWKDGDVLNKRGFLEGNHSELCAEITALKFALDIALNRDIRCITLYTDSELLHNYLKEWRHVWKKTSWPSNPAHKKSQCWLTCCSLSSMLDSLVVQVILGHDDRIYKARQLAFSVEPFEKVRTFGAIQEGNNEPVARYGFYWLPDKTDAEYGFIDGEQSLIRAKQFAILRALQTSITKGITKLVIEHDLIGKEDIDHKLERDIKTMALKLEAVRYETHTSDDFDEQIKNM